MIEQTTLHNILTWVIAVVLFIFQSLNYFIAWIKKYMKHGQKTTTVVIADTTLSSESKMNVTENIITEQGLTQKHFDIPLVSLKSEVIAEDESKVYNFIKSAQLLTSNEICIEKKKIDQFMENLVDDSYVARGLGLITATVGRQSEFYLYSKYDNNFENILIRLNGRNGEIGQITISRQNPANIDEPKSIPMNYFYDKDRIKVTYTPFAEGVHTLTLVRNSLSICRSPYYISVEKSPTNSRSQIRLGTKKYKPVNKFTKSKYSCLETSDNSIPASKPSICRNIPPASEESSIRTDVMSIVTKFESKSTNVQKRAHKRTSSISEKGLETNLINEIDTSSNIQPKVKTNNVYDTYVSDLNSPSIDSKSICTDNKFWNDMEIINKNSDINAIDFENEWIKEPMTKLNECIGTSKHIPGVKNVSLTHLKPTNSILVENLNIGNLHEVEKYNQTFKTTEFIDEKNQIETLLDPTTGIDESEIKCIDDEPCLQNEVSCFDDDDRKTVVVMENSNEIESIPNETVIQQITDSAQYNINTPFTSVITKITNSICEKCAIKVSKIISEFPRDINITHNNNSNEMRSNFETLLAQPISININIDNMFEHPISATNKHNNEHLLTNSPTKIKSIDITDKDKKCHYLNEIEPVDNNSDELCGDNNIMSNKLTTKQNKHNSKIGKTIGDEIIDNCIVPFAEHTIDKNEIVHQNDEFSTNGIMKIKYSTTNKDNLLHPNQFNNMSIHKSESKMEIQGQHLQKSLIKTNQFHENINKELNRISKKNNKPLDTSDLVTVNYDKNANEELVIDEFKIKNIIIPDENTNTQSSVIKNTVLASVESTLVTSEYKSEDNEEQENNITYKNVTLPSIQNENQKLMIEKSIEPVLDSFKNKMIEQITKLYLNKDLSNADCTSIFETHDKHLTNNLQEIQIKNNANITEINTKYIKTHISQLKNPIDTNKKSEIILGQKKTNDNHLFKYVENITKTNINPIDLYAQKLGEKKLHTLVNTIMDHPNDQQKIDNDLNKIIKDNETQNINLKKIDNGETAQDIEAILVETPSVTIIKNTDELILSKNEVTVKTECKIPLINDFDTVEIENPNTDINQEIQAINKNENVTIAETNAMKIKALQNFQKSHNKEIINPIIELRPTLKTQIMNNAELVTVEEQSSKEIQTTNEMIGSINILEETKEVENIDDKNEYESVKLQSKENVMIKIPHLVEKETLNEVVENISTNTCIISNSTENKSIQVTKKQEIESPELKKICDANDVTIDRDIIYNLPPINIAENIVIDKPNPQNISTLKTQISKNAAQVTIGINTLDPQFSNPTITLLIPSKIPIIENNSFIPKLKILSPLNKFDAIEILTIPKYSATCDTKKATTELQNISESTLSPNKLNNMKNRKLEKIENIDETRIPNYTAVVTLEYLNKFGKIKSIPPFANDTLLENIEESKTEKNTLNSKYNLTILEPTVNKINCNNKKGKTSIPISSSAEEVMEKTIKKHTDIESTPPINSQSETDKKVDEMVVCTEAVSPSFIDTITAPFLHKIVVEFVTNKNKTPIEALEIIVHEQKEKYIETLRETTSTMNSLVVVMDEPLNIKNDRSDTYYVKSDNNVTNTETKAQKSIDQNIVEKIIENESMVPINTLTGVVMENPNVSIVTVPAITSCTNSSTVTVDVQTDVEKFIEEESSSPINSLSELVQQTMNMDINTENKTLLPIESTMESIKKPKIVDDITKTEILSCTESSTKITNHQNYAEKIVAEVPIISLDERDGNMNMNIVTETEILLDIGSTKESIVEPEVEKNISINARTSCIDLTRLTKKAETDIEQIIEKKNMVLNNSLGEVVEEYTNMNIDAENETLLQIDKNTAKEKKEKYELNQTLLPMKSTMEYINEPKVVEDITETKITSCTISSTKIIHYQDHTEKIFDQDPSPEQINFSEVEVEGKSKAIIVKENETYLPIVSTIEFIEKPNIFESIIATEISYCTEYSNEIIEMQIDPNSDIVESSQTPIDFLDEIAREKTKVNINTKYETLLPITNSVEELEVRDDNFETVLPIESVVEFIQEPEVEDDTTKIEITSRTDSSTVVIQMDIQKIIEEESSVPISSLEEVVEENTNVNNNTETEISLLTDTISGSMEEKKEKYELINVLSTMESKGKPKEIEDTAETEIQTFTEPLPEIIHPQNHAAKIVDKMPINFIDEVVGENTKLNIVTESETVLMIESTMDPMEEQKEVEDTSGVNISSCTDFSTETLNIQTDDDNVDLQVAPVSINCVDVVVEEKMTLNIDKENETSLLTDTISGSTEEKKEKNGLINALSTIKSTMESKGKPKEVKDTAETENQTFTEPLPEIIHPQNHAAKIVDKMPINFIDEVVGENTKLNIVTESETVLMIESTMDPMEEQKEVEDTSGVNISSCTDFSTETLNIQTDDDNVDLQVAPVSINCVDVVVEEKMTLNIDKENETSLLTDTISGSTEEKKEKDGLINALSTIKSTMESKGKPKEVEDTAETEIQTFTEPLPEIIHPQNHAAKIVDKMPINFIDEVVGENTKLNIVTESETVLMIESTMDPMEEQKEVEDTNGVNISSCTDFSTETLNIQTDDDNVDLQVAPVSINCVDVVVEEKMTLNIDKENETSLLTDTISGSTEEKKEKNGLINALSTIKSTMESKGKPKEVKDTAETENQTFTEPLPEIIHPQNHAAKIVDKMPINFIDEVVGENTKLNIVTESETVLMIESTMYPMEEQKEVEDTSGVNISSCTDFSTETLNIQTDDDNVDLQVAPVSINCVDVVVEEKMTLNIDKENETSLLTDTISGSTEEKKEKDGLINALSTIKSTMESKGKPKEVEDTAETEIQTFTEPLPEIIHPQNHAAKIVDKMPINFIDEVVGENTKLNIVTESETVLMIESTMDPMEEQKEVEDTSGVNISSCTDFSTETLNIQTDDDNVDLQVAPVSINCVDVVVEEKMTLNIDKENETSLLTDTIMESDKQQVEADIKVTEISSSTESFTVTVNPETNVDKLSIDESLSPISSSGKVFGEYKNVNIDTENETFLSIKFSMESITTLKLVDDITETEMSPCICTVRDKTDLEKAVDEVTPELIKSPDEVMGEKTNMNIDTIDEIILPIKISTGSMKDRKVIERITEIGLPIESTMEFKEEPKEVENITITEIISYTDSLSKIVEKVFEEVSPGQIDSSGMIIGEKTKVDMDTKCETVLSIESIKESKVVEDITETKITDKEKYITEKSPAPIKSSIEEYRKSKVNIDRDDEKKLQIISRKESIEETKVKPNVVTDTKIPTCTEYSALMINYNNHTEKIVDEIPINSIGDVVDENLNMNIVTESETLILIGSTKESTVKPKVEEDLAVIALTSCTDSSPITLNVQTDVEIAIEDVSPAPINSSSEVAGESTNLNIGTINKTLLQIDTSTTAVEYSTPTDSSLLDVEKQNINVIIDSKTETLLSIETNTTFVNKPIMVRYVSENEHTALMDSSNTSVKQQLKIDAETEIETLLLIDNLTESAKEQIVEKITPTLIDSLAEIVEEVNVDTNNQTLLTINTSFTIVDDQITKNDIKNETQTPIHCILDVTEEQTKVNIETNNESMTSIDIFTASVEEQFNVEYLCENENTTHIDLVSTMIKNQTDIDIEKEVEHITAIENVLPFGTSTTYIEEEIQVEEVIKNEFTTLINYLNTHDVVSLEEPKVIKNETTAMISSVTVMEEQAKVAANEVVINTCKESLDNPLEKDTQNETTTPIDILVAIAKKQTEKVVENEIPLLVDTYTESIEKHIDTEKITENEIITQIACGALLKIETNKYEAESENETSTPVNNSALITIEQTKVENVTEKTLSNDDPIMYKNLIDGEIKTEHSDNHNNCFLKFGETSKMLSLENNLQRNSYDIHKLEMSVQRMKTSDEDYYGKTFVQLEQTEKNSEVDKVNADGENKTSIDDKLYTVNESDLNAILCASSLEEALTLLDSKIKFKFKHKKSSSKINSVEYIPKIQIPDSKSSGVNTNFTDAREFFKEIEKKSKK